MTDRRRLARRLVLVLAGAVVLPFAWEPATVADHVNAALVLASLSAAAMLAVHREPTEDERYAAALPNAVALRVDLRHARVAATHERDGRTHVVLTWREARTVLLDAAHAPLTSIGRNHLATGWTMSVAFDDDAVPRLLARDRHGGGLSLLAAVDAAHDPWARIGNSPLHLRRCDVDFPSWTGEAPLRRIPTGW